MEREDNNKEMTLSKDKESLKNQLIPIVSCHSTVSIPVLLCRDLSLSLKRHCTGEQRP